MVDVFEKFQPQASALPQEQVPRNLFMRLDFASFSFGDWPLTHPLHIMCAFRMFVHVASIIRLC